MINPIQKIRDKIHGEAEKQSDKPLTASVDTSKLEQESAVVETPKQIVEEPVVEAPEQEKPKQEVVQIPTPVFITQAEKDKMAYDTYIMVKEIYTALSK